MGTAGRRRGDVTAEARALARAWPVAEWTPLLVAYGPVRLALRDRGRERAGSPRLGRRSYHSIPRRRVSRSDETNWPGLPRRGRDGRGVGGGGRLVGAERARPGRGGAAERAAGVGQGLVDVGLAVSHAGRGRVLRPARPAAVLPAHRPRPPAGRDGPAAEGAVVDGGGRVVRPHGEAVRHRAGAGDGAPRRSPVAGRRSPVAGCRWSTSVRPASSTAPGWVRSRCAGRPRGASAASSA